MAIKHVMVSVGAFSNSLVPAKYALALAKQLQAKLTAVHVINEKVLQDLLKSRVFVETEARQYQRDLEEQGRVFLERLQKLAQEKGVVMETVLTSGEISVEVVKKAQELQADILVMGELKEVFSTRDFFYDEGERLFRRCFCPVLVVKNACQAETLFNEA
jgi:nucleotide-binding universal stress UspA family protein